MRSRRKEGKMIELSLRRLEAGRRESGQSLHGPSSQRDEGPKAASSLFPPYLTPQLVLLCQVSSLSNQARSHLAMTPSPTASFATLPNELRVSIIATACQDDYDFAGVSGEKALNLMLTSRDTYAITAPLLYKNIKITKPSVLADFERALTSHPDLGLLVKSLWLGPDRHLPHDWWPIKNCEPEAAAFGWQEIKTSLKEQTQLPRGCAPLASWLLKSSKRRATPLSDAIIDAVESAQAGLGVTLSRPCRDSRDNEIGSAEYVIRVMEVQAALDLYLIELRRLEDEERSDAEGFPTSEPRPKDNEPDSRYPRLVIVAAKASSSERSDGLDSGSSDCSAQTFSLTRSKLVEHLARRGGSGDYFDHPLITARSDLQTFTFVDDWQPDFATLARRLSALHDSIVSKAPLHPVCGKISASIPDRDCPPTASARGLLRMGRSVLSMLPRLENLFFNSFLQQLACGQSAHELPPTVCTVSLGPLSPWHPDSLAPACVEGRLDYLEQLFLCGTEYAKEKVAAIAATPILQQADWDLKNNNVEWDG